MTDNQGCYVQTCLNYTDMDYWQIVFASLVIRSDHATLIGHGPDTNQTSDYKTSPVIKC
jgi:hypothetical protein